MKESWKGIAIAAIWIGVAISGQAMVLAMPAMIATWFVADA